MMTAGQFRRRLLHLDKPSPTSGKECLIRWWDYQGNVVKEETIYSGGSVKNPYNLEGNEYITFVGWTHNGKLLQDITHGLDIVALYETKDGYLRLIVDVSAGQTVSFQMNNNVVGTHSYTLVWGDGSREDITIPNESDYITVSHTYSSAYSGAITIVASTSERIILESGDYVKAIYGIGGRRYPHSVSRTNLQNIDYITFGTRFDINPTHHPCHDEYVTCLSPVVLNDVGRTVIDGGSFPACYIVDNNEGGNENTYLLTKMRNVSGLTRVINKKSGTTLAISDMPDLEYLYINGAVTNNKGYGDTDSFLANCPKLKKVDVGARCILGTTLDLTKSTLFRGDSLDSFLQSLSTLHPRHIYLTSLQYYSVQTSTINSLKSSGYIIHY